MKTIHLERQITRLKREKNAAKEAQRVSERKVEKARSESKMAHAALVGAQQRNAEQVNEIMSLLNRVEELDNAWSRFGVECRRILLTPWSLRWYNIRRPFVRWYAIHRLTPERIDAMASAAYEGEAYVKMAENYLQWDMEQRKYDSTPIIVRIQGRLAAAIERGRGAYRKLRGRFAERALDLPAKNEAGARYSVSNERQGIPGDGTQEPSRYAVWYGDFIQSERAGVEQGPGPEQPGVPESVQPGRVVAAGSIRRGVRAEAGAGGDHASVRAILEARLVSNYPTEDCQ